jgi:Coenzyme PQQ synthesis protein D (PqqD)
MLRKPNNGDCDMPVGQEEHVFVRSRTVVSRVVAGETLIVPVRGKVGDLASIYSFNATGSLIWQLLDTPRGRAELIGAVEREYQVGQEQAQKDVAQFLEEMLAVGLVEICQVEVCPRGAMTATEMTAVSKQQVELETAGWR